MRRLAEKMTIHLLVVGILVGLLGAGAMAQEIVLDFPSWQVTEPGTSDWYRALIEQFERENPGVKINFNHIPFTNYVRTMITRFAAGEVPDIFHVPAADLMAFAREGWLENLDPYLATTDVLETWSPLQEGLQYEGNNVAVLVLGYGFVLGYNQKMLDEAGVAVPTTVEELLEVAKAVTKDVDGDGLIDQYGMSFPTVKHAGLYNEATKHILNAGGHWTNENGELNRPAIIAGLTTLKAMLDSGAVPMGLDNNGKRQFWIEGKAAMMTEGPWIEGYIDSAPADVRPHLRVAPLPFANGPVGGASNVLAIAADLPPERKELAWKFIELMTRPESQKLYASIGGQPPARAGVVDDEILAARPNMKLYAEQAEIAVDYTAPGTQLYFTQFRDAALDMILEVLLNNADPNRALDQLEQRLRRVR